MPLTTIQIAMKAVRDKKERDQYEQSLTKNINDVFNKLYNPKHEDELRKMELLITILKYGVKDQEGFKRLKDRIIKKGMPKYAFIGVGQLGQFDPILKELLTIKTHPAIKDGHIVLSWEELHDNDYGIPKYLHKDIIKDTNNFQPTFFLIPAGSVGIIYKPIA